VTVGDRGAPFELESGLQAILDNSAAAIFAKDTEGRYTIVNEAFLHPAGLSRHEVIGRTAAELWPETYLPSGAELKVLAKGVVDTSDETVDLADGAHTIMAVRFPLRDSEGRIGGMAAIATDVTQRRAAEDTLRERNRLLDTMLKASPDIVTVIDAGGRVMAVSEASASILGYDLSDPVHEEVEALVHDEDLPAIYKAYARLLAGRDEVLDMRYRVRHRDGHWVILETRGQAIVDESGAVAGAVVVSRDVTEDLELEQELHSALAAAERASTAKSTFLSRMSHELRTPLNSVLGFAQLLDMEELPPDRAEAVGHILQGGNHLLDLIDEVLDITRIESGHLDLLLQPVELVRLLREAVDLIGPMAERRSVSLTLETGDLPEHERVVADRQRLLQVLLNLLSNAVKYNSPGGHVAVTPKALEVAREGTAHGVAQDTKGTPAPWPATGQGAVQVAVADDGPGIPADATDSVFEPFERLGAEGSSVEGTGVGLALSRHLVEQMGGTISVSSVPGEGSTFVVTLARTPGAAPQRGSDGLRAGSVAAAPAGGFLRVLYVEDNLANLELVEQVLARAGDVELLSATHGAQALQLVRDERPDLVLLDLQLPDMPGSEVAERLHSDPSTSAIPLVIVSADPPDVLSRALSEGAIAWLTKPIDVRELLGILRRVVDAVRGPG